MELLGCSPATKIVAFIVAVVLRTWAKETLKRKATHKYAFKVTAVALANKLARIVYAILRSGGTYDDRPVATRA